MAHLEGLSEVQIDPAGGLCIRKIDRILKVQKQTAVVHIHSSYNTLFIIAEHDLGVQEARSIGIDPDTMIRQISEGGLRQAVYQLLVRDPRNHDTYIHSTLCSDARHS